MATILSEEDQERYLDRGLKKIKAQSFHIHTAIEKNNLRQCLKETYSMLNELNNLQNYEEMSQINSNIHHLFEMILSHQNNQNIL